MIKREYLQAEITDENYNISILLNKFNDEIRSCQILFILKNFWVITLVLSLEKYHLVFDVYTT